MGPQEADVWKSIELNLINYQCCDSKQVHLPGKTSPLVHYNFSWIFKLNKSRHLFSSKIGNYAEKICWIPRYLFKLSIFAQFKNSWKSGEMLPVLLRCSHILPLNLALRRESAWAMSKLGKRVLNISSSWQAQKALSNFLSSKYWALQVIASQPVVMYRKVIKLWNDRQKITESKKILKHLKSHPKLK